MIGFYIKRKFSGVHLVEERIIYSTETPLDKGNTHYVLCGVELAHLMLGRKKDWRRVCYNKAHIGSVRRFSHVEHPNVSTTSFKRDLEAIRSPQCVKTEPLASFPFAALKEGSPLSLDIETSGFNPYAANAQIHSVCLALDYDVAYVGSFAEFKELYTLLAQMVPDLTIVGQNLKFDMLWLEAFGINCSTWEIRDTMVREFMRDENVAKSLDTLILRHLPFFTNYWAGFNYDRLGSGKPLSVPELSTLYTYNGYDSCATLAVYDVQKVDDGRLEQFEMMKLKMLLKIETNRVHIDRVLLKKKKTQTKRSITKLEKTITKYLVSIGKQDLNFNSSTQLRQHFFEDMGYTPVCMTPKGNPATNEEAIEALQRVHPDDVLLASLVESRAQSKLLATYYENIDAQCKDNDSPLIRCNYNQARVVTGRLSSDSPNLQNIPSRDKEAVKSLFTSRFDNGVILEADYSQMELRMLADLSNDTAMMEAFDSNEDFHTSTANALGVSRQEAKTINFKIIYGGGSKAQTDMWFKAYPKAKAYMDLRKREWKQYEDVESLFGHRRHLGTCRGLSWAENGHKERQAVNFPVQCVSAQITCLAIHLIMEQFPPLLICNTVHDSIIIDVPSDINVVELAGYIQRIMEHEVVEWMYKELQYDVIVPLKADITCGPSWAHQTLIETKGEEREHYRSS